MADRACAACGADADQDDLFCWRCGDPVDGTGAAGSAAAGPGEPSITDPPAPPPGYAAVGPSASLAGWWARAASLVIDAVACSVPLWVALAVAGAAAARQPRVLHPDEPGVSGTLATALVLGWVVLVVGYFTALNGRFRGQTLGNLALGIAVRDARQDRPIGLVRGFLRCFLRFGLYSVFLLPGILSDLFPLWTGRRQTAVDKLVRSVVVKL